MHLSKYKRKISLVLFSVFIIWHAIGIGIVGPSPNSHLRDMLMVVYGDYLRTLKMNGRWHFYSPNPALGRILSYEAIGDSGHKERLPLTRARHKFNHAYFRYTNFYNYLFGSPDYSVKQGYDQDVAKYLCRSHLEKNITEINFVLRYQKSFSISDYHNGKRPLDDDFLGEEQVFGPFKCE